jgi:glycosyltransferase involved in cell wall biosynthesis
MNIIIGCSSSPDHGSGILTYSKEIAEQLLRLGNEIHFVSPAPNHRTWLEQHRIPHFATSQHHDPAPTTRQLLQYIHDQRIDAVINNDNPYLQSIAPGLQCPFIAVGHLGRTSIAALACYRSEWTDYVVAISNDMQRSYVTKYNVPITKCPIIYNGILDNIGNTTGVNDNSPVLRALYAGGYNRKLKGADLVLKMALKDQRLWKGIELAWYGEVPDNIRQRLAHLPHVRVHGRVPRDTILQALRNSDVLLFPSRVEGCPMAMLEAMSFSVVPIASDGEGAMQWLVTSGQDGYICHLSHWPTQAMECLTNLRDHPAALRNMKYAARKRFLDEYQSSMTAGKLLRLIQQPTVDRSRTMTRFEVLRWHRPLRPDGLRSPLLDRICFHSGVLRKAGILDIRKPL